MTTPLDPIEVRHDAQEQRFFLRLDGYEACLMYRRQGQEADFYHTYVPEVFRGRGVADRLCQAAFEHARAHGWTVSPSCSYITDAYLRRHPEYEAIVKRGPTSRPRVSG